MWKEDVAQRALVAMQARQAREHAERLAACLAEWRPYVLRRCPIKPTEGREVTQDQVYQQLLLETIGGGAQA